MTAVLEAEGIDYYYEEERPVLEGVNLILKAGDSVSICGPSGVGKTTLLEILGTMRSPRSGTVEIMGKTVYGKNLAERSAIRGQHLGFVFQEALLLPDLTVLENCRLATALSNSKETEAELFERYSFLMSQLGLDPSRGDERPGQFSTGERQRIAVVRALVHQPDLLIADEPTGNLDPDSSDRLLELLFPLVEEQGVAVLVATHDPKLADSLEKTLWMKQGRLEEQAPETSSP